MRLNLTETLTEINSLEGKLIKLGGTVYKIELYLSGSSLLPRRVIANGDITGDWKFLRTVLGLSAPNMDFFCLWCKCQKASIAYNKADTKWDICRTHEESSLLRGAYIHPVFTFTHHSTLSGSAAARLDNLGPALQWTLDEVSHVICTSTCFIRYIDMYIFMYIYI
jgi:hypothetical protein